MQILNYLQPDCACAQQHLTTSKALFQFLAQHISAHCSASEKAILSAFSARERLGSTGLGRGVAIPHARLPELKSAQLALLTLVTPLEFNAPDERPVDIFFALVVPETEPELHLKLLAELSAHLADEATCQALRCAHHGAELFHILEEHVVSYA